MKWVADTELIPADWDRICQQASGELDSLPVCELYPALSIQPSQNGRRYKFRRYASSAEAKEKLKVLETLRGALPVTPLVAVDDEVLCFEYIESAAVGDDPANYQAMGAWLGSLAAKTWEWESPSAFDAYHARWLEELEQSGFFSRIVIQRARANYDAIRPDELAMCVNYWDAMPPNFGVQNGEVILLDEKHLRTGPVGIGLVKPRLFLQQSAYDALLGGYRMTAPGGTTGQSQAFLEVVYRTYALWFYLHGMRIGVTSYDGNSRLRRFREAFFEMYDLSAAEIRRDRFIFFLHFPQQTSRYFWKRVKRWTRRIFHMHT